VAQGLLIPYDMANKKGHAIYHRASSVMEPERLV